MTKNDLLHHAYFDNESVKIEVTESALKINKKTEQSVSHKQIKKVCKNVQNTLMRAKKRETEAVNHEFEITQQLQTE